MRHLVALKSSFIQYGWLLPIWIPAGFMLQRGYGNALLGLYVIWAIVALGWRFLLDMRGASVWFYLALVISGYISAIISIDPPHSIHAWSKFLLLSITFLITIPIAARKVEAIEIATKMAGLVGVLTIVLFITQFLYHAAQPHFSPATQVRGLVPAYLLPFAFVWLLHRYGLASAMVVTGVFLAFLSQADGRTEMLTAGVSLTVFWMVYKRDWVLPLVLLAVCMVPITFGRYYQNIHHESSFSLENNSLNGDVVTSGRTILWKKAINSPPDNWLFGVGPSNVYLYPVVKISETNTVKHLHNLFLDAWYETGALGLAFYIGLIASLCLGVKRVYLTDLTNRIQLTLWVASFVSIIAASMLEQSYRSYHLAHFGLFGLTLLCASSCFKHVE